MNRNEIVERPCAPHIVGTGLLALDLIVQRSPSGTRYSASGGGTCGNVLAILAHMGWRSSWLGALDDSAHGHLVRSEMERAGVCLHLAPNESVPPVPVFAHHIDVDANGHASHWFSDSCPHCGRKLPSYERPSDAWLDQQTACTLDADVFFADRLSDSIISLAARAKGRGALIVYEPSVVSDAPWIADMVELADVVKYAVDRYDALSGSTPSSKGALWIETMGQKGLRWSLGHKAQSYSVQAVHNPAAIDACGAGDWFTSALLFLLSGTGHKPTELAPTQLTHLMKIAAGVAAWSCSYLGARGALYDAPIRSVFEQLHLAGEPATSRQKLVRPEPYLDDGSNCTFIQCAAAVQG